MTKEEIEEAKDEIAVNSLFISLIIALAMGEVKQFSKVIPLLDKLNAEGALSKNIYNGLYMSTLKVVIVSSENKIDEIILPLVKKTQDMVLNYKPYLPNKLLDTFKETQETLALLISKQNEVKTILEEYDNVNK